METVKETEKLNKEDNLIPFKKGESGNPNGRPKGKRSYTTIRREAFKKIGETKGMTPEEVEELMITSGLQKALEGDAKFYQDDLDRAYGKPKQSVGVEGQGEDGEIIVRVKMV